MKTTKGKSRFIGIIVLFLIFFASVPNARPEEGMWTFDNPPLKLWKDKYGFTPAPLADELEGKTPRAIR